MIIEDCEQTGRSLCSHCWRRYIFPVSVNCWSSSLPPSRGFVCLFSIHFIIGSIQDFKLVLKGNLARQSWKSVQNFNISSREHPHKSVVIIHKLLRTIIREVIVISLSRRNKYLPPPPPPPHPHSSFSSSKLGRYQKTRAHLPTFTSPIPHYLGSVSFFPLWVSPW